MNKRQKKKKYTMCLKTIRKAIRKYYRHRINIDSKVMNYRYFKYSDYAAWIIKEHKDSSTIESSTTIERPIIGIK